jgi:hypothetical protein
MIKASENCFVNELSDWRSIHYMSGSEKVVRLPESIIQGVSKRALQRHSKRYCVASVTKAFTLKGEQTVDHSSP